MSSTWLAYHAVGTVSNPHIIYFVSFHCQSSITLFWRTSLDGFCFSAQTYVQKKETNTHFHFLLGTPVIVRNYYDDGCCCSVELHAVVQENWVLNVQRQHPSDVNVIWFSGSTLHVHVSPSSKPNGVDCMQAS